MADRADYLACLRRLVALGYDLNTAKRLAAWATDPDQPVYPENTK